MDIQSKYLKYKKKYLELKQKGGRVGDFFDYSNDDKIKKLFYLKTNKTLNIYWSLNDKVITSPIIKAAKFDDKMIFITESGSVYITKIPKQYDISPGLSDSDFK